MLTILNFVAQHGYSLLTADPDDSLPFIISGKRKGDNMRASWQFMPSGI